MPKLILSGGTGKNKEKKLSLLFLKEVGNKNILYIPLAMKPSRHNICKEWIENLLKRKVTPLTSFKEKVDLKDFKGIYIGGGNTFKLLKEIKENKWESKLKNFKGIIYGGSAGAVIFAKDISTVSFGNIKDKNEVKLKDLTALNLIDNYNIKCHYEEDEKDSVIEHVKKTKIPIIALPNDSGLIVKNNKIKTINKVHIFK